MNNGLFSSSSNEWETPQELFDELDNEFHFTLDPCATEENAKCDKYFNKTENGLSRSWAHERVFMNPPYGRDIGKWIKKAYEESERALVVCLIPARTDTAYWHDYIFDKAEIRFKRGIIYFKKNTGETGPAPFPSAIVVYRSKEKFEED